jgi:DNA ligase 1
VSTLLAELIATSQDVAATNSRTAKTVRLASFFRALDPGELPTAIGLLRGEPRQGRIGVGYASAFGTSVDPAPVAGLTVADVDNYFVELAGSVGPGSQSRRTRLLADLFGRATASEQDFLRRSLTGEVRQGALAGILTDAVAKAFAVPSTTVRRASMLRADLGEVARVAALEGEPGLLTIGLRVLSPIQPMLASPGASIAESIKGETSVEWKLDGARIQVHRLENEVVVYTRNLNDITTRMPEVVEAVLGLPLTAVVLDGEAMALREDGTPQPFQETMSRFGTEERAIAEVPVVPFRCAALSTLAFPRPNRSAREACPSHHHRRRRGGPGLCGGSNGRRSGRGNDQGRQVLVRGWAARKDLAEGEAGAHI